MAARREEGGKRSFIMEEEGGGTNPFSFLRFLLSPPPFLLSLRRRRRRSESLLDFRECVCVSAPPYLPRRSSRTRHNFFCVSPFSALSLAFDTKMRPQANKKRRRRPLVDTMMMGPQSSTQKGCLFAAFVTRNRVSSERYRYMLFGGRLLMKEGENDL